MLVTKHMIEFHSCDEVGKSAKRKAAAAAAAAGQTMLIT